jgi:hypothetical protein
VRGCSLLRKWSEGEGLTELSTHNMTASNGILGKGTPDVPPWNSGLEGRTEEGLGDGGLVWVCLSVCVCVRGGGGRQVRGMHADVWAAEAICEHTCTIPNTF